MAINLYSAAGGDRQIEQLLAQCGMQVTRISADDMQELAQPNAPQPEAIVLDLRTDARLPGALPLLRRQHPTTPAVLVTSTLDAAVMLEAMRAGVNECVAEPVTRTALETAIRRVMAQRQTAGAGSIYAFLGGKGGVGSTTLAVNVASALAQMADTSALLIDLQLTYGDCALFLGAEPRFSIVDALENAHRFDEAFLRGIVVRTQDGPDLLASSDRLMTTPADARRIQALIEFASQYYTYTVLDLPRSDSAVLDSLSPVSKLIIVISQDLATLRSARAIAGALRNRYGKEKVQVVLSRQDSESEITQEDVEQAIGERVAFTIPSDYRAAVQAVNRGCPLVWNRQGKLSQTLQAYARQLAGLKTEASPRRLREWPAGLLSRLGGKHVPSSSDGPGAQPQPHWFRPYRLSSPETGRGK